MLQSKLYLFLTGLNTLEQSKKLNLDDGTINFFPTKDGYIQNYPGRTDYFDRNKAGDVPATDSWGTPPTAEAGYTRVAAFTDYLGAEHLVFVKGAVLYETDSNGTKTLYTFTGDSIGGKYYPSMFVHGSKLVVLNGGDIPLIWDGVTGVTPLGVQEVPSPPVNVSTGNRFVRLMATNPYIAPNSWYHWEQGSINIGPAERVNDAGAKISGWYETVVQFQDVYGNKGRVSGSSQIYSNPAEVDEWNRYAFNVTWEPPNIDEHITSVIVGRTLTLNPLDETPAGVSGVYHVEAVLDGVTCHRSTQRLTDSGLSGKDLVDLVVGPPPMAAFGTSFGGRIWVVDSNGLIWYSDQVFFGQFRASQTIRPSSRCVAIIPAGDRIFVIGETTTDVYYEGKAGPALLEQDAANGSIYGSSFVSVGDGVIFGLWNQGFGVYDGKQHTYIPMPEYINEYYMKTISPTVSAAKIKDWYYLPIKRGHSSEGNNILLMFSLQRTSWYVVEETIADLCYWNEEIMGVDNSLYVMFRGNTFPESIIHTAGLVLSELNEQTTVSDVRLLMEPSSFNSLTLTIYGDEIKSAETGVGNAYPMKGINMVTLVPEPHWNQSDLLYPTYWISPGDVFLQMRHTKPVVGYYHRVKAVFPSGHLIRLKGIEINHTAMTRPEQK